VVLLAVRWYLRYSLSYRDVGEFLAERGIDVDHVTIYRWVQRFTPLVIDAARPSRHSVGDRWFVDETYVKVAGVWRYVCRAVDQHGQVIDVLVSKRRNMPAATRFFEMMLAGRDRPREVSTDLAAPLLRVVDDLPPEVLHDTTQYGNNRIECDHGRLKATVASNARSTNRPDRVDGNPQARVHPEPAARPLPISESNPATIFYASRLHSTNSTLRSDHTTHTSSASRALRSTNATVPSTATASSLLDTSVPIASERSPRDRCRLARRVL
jgi:IS6 family transposase